MEVAGEASGERMWRLPLWDIYDKLIESDVADAVTVGGRPARAVTAGAFLRNFVPPGVPWAHVDIAGTSWNRGGPAVPDRSHVPKGASGFGLRALLGLAEVGK